MNPTSKARPLVELLLSVAGFSVALAVHTFVVGGGLEPGEALIGTTASSLAFWVATQLKNDYEEELSGAWVILLELFCLGAGINLLLHALMTYGFFVRRTPFLVVAGSFVSAAFVALERTWMTRHPVAQPQFLLIGCDSTARRVLETTGAKVAAYVPDPSCDWTPKGNPQIVAAAGVERFIADHRPTDILVGTIQWRSLISPAAIFKAKLDGLAVEDAPSLYERLYSRVCCVRLRPMDFLLSASLRGDARTMAIQALYNNLIGIFFLLILSPLMLCLTIAMWATGDGGPIFDSIECAGFQYIPFRLHRFRTCRNDGKAPSMAGRFIERFHLEDLPQLVNVVRGDMALVGPRAVRTEFANHLTTVMPFFSHRFSVKPGILGWAQTHRGSSDTEIDEIEYDLYYIRQGSLWMDVEIMLEALFGRRTA